MPTSALTGRQFGTIQGSPGQSGAGAFGTVPVVPDPTSTQAGAISGNQQNLAALYGLGGSLNTNIAQNAAIPYNLNLPNYGAMTGQSSQNILSQLQGQVPQDVANQIQQMAAERGVSTGSIGSPNANTALLRALGLTSLGLQQGAEQQLTSAIGRTPTGQQFNPNSFLTTPEQQQQAAYAGNVYAAAPDPSAAAHAGLNAAQQGLGAGLGTRFNPGVGGGGDTDALGFPNNNFMQGSTISRSGGWGLGNASTPINLNQGDWTMWGGAEGTGGFGALPWQTGVAGGQPWAGNDILSSSTPWDQFGAQAGGAAGGSDWTQGWQAGMPYSPGFGDQPTSTGAYGGSSWPEDLFGDLGGLG